MRCFVTGVAGFIGSNLADRLLSLGYDVVGIDNFSTGNPNFIKQAKKNHKNFLFFDLDVVKDKDYLVYLMINSDIVFHLCANADVRNGTSHPTVDIEQNLLATSNILEAMRRASIKKIVFSSTGSVYGDAPRYPTAENVPLGNQTSFYSASKLACESLIQAYCEAFDFQSYIYRFVSVLGNRYHHGHVLDFYKQLKNNPNKLKVLGNGTQTKSYMHINDCVSGMLAGLNFGKDKINTYNLGTDGFITVKDSVKIICDYLELNPEVTYGLENRGWIGDNPMIYLDTQKIKESGWKPTKTIQEAIVDTVKYLETVED